MRDRSRRDALRALSAAGAAALAGCGGTAGTPTATPTPTETNACENAGGSATTALATGPENWPTYGGDLRNTSTTRATAPDGPIEEAWRLEASGEHPFVGSPAVVDGTVYVGHTTPSGGAFVALNANDGSAQWESDVRASLYTPTVLGDTVYPGGDVGRLYSLDAGNGGENWHVDLEYFASAPTVYDASVYVTNGGTVYSVGTTKGSRQWTIEKGIEWETGERSGWYFEDIAPALADGVLYLGTSEGIIHAIDPSDGRSYWRFDPFRFISPSRESGRPKLGVAGSPVVAGNRVFYSTRAKGYSNPDVPSPKVESHLIALSRCDGSVAWRRSLGTETVAADSPAVWNDTVLFPASDTLWAVDAASGDKRWRLALDSEPVAPPVVVDGTREDTVYLGVGTEIVAIDPYDGTVHWRVDAGSRLSTHLAVSEGRILVGTEDGVLHAFA